MYDDIRVVCLSWLSVVSHQFNFPDAELGTSHIYVAVDRSNSTMIRQPDTVLTRGWPSVGGALALVAATALRHELAFDELCPHIANRDTLYQFANNTHSPQFESLATFGAAWA
jgi:hypothetical protein